MYLWYCKYCNGIYTSSSVCVFHEINECLKNPKFHHLEIEKKYEIKNNRNYNERHTSYKKCME